MLVVLFIFFRSSREFGIGSNQGNKLVLEIVFFFSFVLLKSNIKSNIFGLVEKEKYNLLWLIQVQFSRGLCGQSFRGQVQVIEVFYFMGQKEVVRQKGIFLGVVIFRFLKLVFVGEYGGWKNSGLIQVWVVWVKIMYLGYLLYFFFSIFIC